MAAGEETGRKKRKMATPERNCVPVAKRRAQDAHKAKPRRSSPGDDAGERNKKKGTNKAPKEIVCVFCFEKPAFDHLLPGEHKENTEYWCNDCWSEYRKNEKSGEGGSSADSSRAQIVKVVRSHEEYAEERSRMLYFDRFSHYGAIFSQELGDLR